MEKVDLIVSGILLVFLVFAYCTVTIDVYKESKSKSNIKAVVLFLYYIVLPVLLLTCVATFMVNCIKFFGGCDG